MVLVVEDHVPAAVALVRLLKCCGRPAEYRTTVKDAVARLSEITPAAILLDIMLPDGTGLDVLAIVRADPRLAGTPVVVFTGGDDQDVRLAADQLGVQGWLIKGTATLDQILDALSPARDNVQRPVPLDVDAHHARSNAA